jgi:hypothetical protein
MTPGTHEQSTCGHVTACEQCFFLKSAVNIAWQPGVLASTQVSIDSHFV